MTEPFRNDHGARRYRIMHFDIDSRATFLNDPEPTDAGARECWETSRKGIIEGLAAEYGTHHIHRKVADFAALGARPFSIVAYHNTMMTDVRAAFTAGAYYAALTGACALGERILNHLMLDLRDHFKSSHHYKKIYSKESFDKWEVPITCLTDWGVLLPDVANEYWNFKQTRNNALHFNAETANQLREDALKAIGHLDVVVGQQFSAFGLQPWFISEIPGASYIRKSYESDPFVRHFYIRPSPAIGPYHSVEWRNGFQFVDHPDYSVFGFTELTDEEFTARVQDVPPEWATRMPDNQQ